MSAAVTLGLLQLIALKFPQAIWERKDFYQRTCSRQIPSERTVKSVMARLLINNLFIVAPVAIIRKIKERYFGGKDTYHHSVPKDLAN